MKANVPRTKTKDKIATMHNRQMICSSKKYTLESVETYIYIQIYIYANGVGYVIKHLMKL